MICTHVLSRLNRAPAGMCSPADRMRAPRSGERYPERRLTNGVTEITGLRNRATTAPGRCAKCLPDRATARHTPPVGMPYAAKVRNVRRVIEFRIPPVELTR